MISRRDKLLVRPWEQRRYENHRRKVQSALPAIDVGPPPNRVHVFYKLKKQQKEYERCDKIEKDNFKLLQRMRSLMSTTRVDNTWTTAQPNFLNRVSMYGSSNSDKSMCKKREVPSPEFDNTRKGRCHACTPKKTTPMKIPEERIPWEPPKSQVSRRRSLSLPPTRKVQIQTPPKEDKPPRKLSPKPAAEIKSSVAQRRTTRKIYPESSSAQSIILTRGDLHLAVNFPPDTMVTLKEGSTERFLIPGPCQCKAIRS
ncbi:uncharacterized protein CBL_05809 [Carabus blaptoides fortunei]